MPKFEVEIAGRDTGAPLNVAKRLRVIAPYVRGEGVKVLDGGCGAGEYVLALRNAFGVEAHGVEYLADKVAAFQAAHPGLDWVRHGDLQALSFPAATFDVVLLNEVLEHVPDESRALAEVMRVLKPGGHLVIFCPNRLYPFEQHGVYLKSGKLLTPWFPLIPYLPTRLGSRMFKYWARNYWPHELRGIIRKAGFVIDRTTYVWQTFEGISQHQPALVGRMRGFLRGMANLMERVPVAKALGVSQVIVARKPGVNPAANGRSAPA